MSSAFATASQPYHDMRLGLRVETIMPGHHFVSNDPGVALMTLLGSCVAACIRDTEAGIGGLNHFLLPDSGPSDTQASARYGVYAMEVLINTILRQGGSRRSLEAKVFGGGNVLDVSSKDPVGTRNCTFVCDFLNSERIPITASDLGGTMARRILFVPTTGRARVQHIGGDAARSARRREVALREAASTPRPARIELF